MTPEQLKRLIAPGESMTVEFKGEERGNLSDNDLVEAIVCLANRPSADDAHLIVGIEDDGRVTGTAQLTASDEPDTDPTVGADGTIVFVRGRNATADLWIRSADGGEERRLKEGDAVEHGPVFSPDGEELLYVAGRRLRHVTFDDEGEIDEDEALVPGMTVASAAWSPDGERHRIRYQRQPRQRLRGARRRPLLEPDRRVRRRPGVVSGRGADHPGRANAERAGLQR